MSLTYTPMFIITRPYLVIKKKNKWREIRWFCPGLSLCLSRLTYLPLTTRWNDVIIDKIDVNNEIRSRLLLGALLVATKTSQSLYLSALFYFFSKWDREGEQENKSSLLLLLLYVFSFALSLSLFLCFKCVKMYSRVCCGMSSKKNNNKYTTNATTTGRHFLFLLLLFLLHFFLTTWSKHTCQKRNIRTYM